MSIVDISIIAMIAAEIPRLVSPGFDVSGQIEKGSTISTVNYPADRLDGPVDRSGTHRAYLSLNKCTREAISSMTVNSPL
jgi:hypothetical protein